jgi:Leucine-rich repeat (LRR) protein
VCGFGVDRNPNRDTWKFDASGCGMEVFGGEWYDAFTDLEVLDLSDNELMELPLWLGQGEMRKLKELRARGNKVGAFVDGMLGGENTTLVEVDLRDNEIAELPYELMDAESENTTLLFDGNPCAEEVDWSGLGVDRLPARMVGEGYENGDFHNSLKVLKMGRNRFDGRVIGELVAANFTNIEELDVSWNALRGVEEEEVRGLKKLRRLDVSGNREVSVE